MPINALSAITGAVNSGVVTPALANVAGTSLVKAANTNKYHLVPSLNGSGSPVAGAKVTPEVSATKLKFTQVDLNTAALAQTTKDMGVVIDIIDSGGTAIAVDKVLAITPDGQAVDFNALVRTKAQFPFLRAIPAGTWTFINVSGGALTGLEVTFHNIDD